MSEAARLRAKLRDRRTKKAETPPLKFPFILDEALAASVVQMTRTLDQLEARADHWREQIEAADEVGARDVRASGDDTSGMATKLATAEAEIERLRGELSDAVDQANADRFHLVFAPCGTKKYEKLLAQFPGVDEDLEVTIAFKNALLEMCFVRFEKDDKPLDLFDSWQEFLTEAAPEFGELDPWRTAVLIACNRDPHHILPG